jgi:hypothetical protein
MVERTYKGLGQVAGAGEPQATVPVGLQERPQAGNKQEGAGLLACLQPASPEWLQRPPASAEALPVNIYLGWCLLIGSINRPLWGFCLS